MNGFAVTRFDLFWHLLFSIPTNKLTHGICTYCVYRYGIEVYAINLISPSYVCRFMNGARLLVASLKQIPPKRSAKASHESNSIFHCDILLNIFEIRFNFLNCLGKINSTYIPGPTLHKFVRGWASHIRCKSSYHFHSFTTEKMIRWFCCIWGGNIPSATCSENAKPRRRAHSKWDWL